MVYADDLVLICCQVICNTMVTKPLKGTFTHARSERGRMWAENWLQHKSLNAFTHTRSQSGGGAGAKSAPQEMGPTLNYPHPLQNRVLQTIFVFRKWQIRLLPLRICMHINAVAERECQNPPVSALQPLRACVNVAWCISGVPHHMRCYPVGKQHRTPTNGAPEGPLFSINLYSILAC